MRRDGVKRSMTVVKCYIEGWREEVERAYCDEDAGEIGRQVARFLLAYMLAGFCVGGAFRSRAKLCGLCCGVQAWRRRFLLRSGGETMTFVVE